MKINYGKGFNILTLVNELIKLIMILLKKLNSSI